MKPELLNEDGTVIVLNGAVSCSVTEERNGLYELKMVYNANDGMFSHLELGSVIIEKPNDTDRRQQFRIYRITLPLNGKVTVYAEHISYRMSQIPVRPFELVNVSAQAALNALNNNVMISCPFTFVTDITTVSNYSVGKPSTLKNKLIGEQGSIVQIYGGEYKYDDYSVSLLRQRGADNGVELLYGKNITDLKQEENISKTYSGICPYWLGTDEDGETEIVVTLPEEIVYASNHESFPYERVVPIDLSDKFEDEPTAAQLRSAAEAYIRDNDVGTPDVSITVSFIPLWQAQGYEDLKKLEHVSLCDTVTVFFPKLGVNAKSKVVKTVYNCLKERYDSITIGTIKQNFVGTMSGVVRTQDDTNKKLKTAISKKVQAVRGTLNSNQGSGAKGTWERVGNTVTLSCEIVKTAASWTIFNNLPIPAWETNKEVQIGMAGTYPVYIVSNQAGTTGFLQIRTTGTFTTPIYFSGSYLCK